MVIACAIVFLASVVLELIKFIRVQVERRFESERYANIFQIYCNFYKNSQKICLLKSLNFSSFNTSYTSRLFSLQHLIETLLFGIQITLSYILMLVFMTFSVWLGLAVALGLATGYYFFGARQFNVKTSEAVLVGHVTHN